MALLAAVVLLAACRLDVGVEMTMASDGTGEVVLAATVDKDVVDQVPGLAGSLGVADATAAGWLVDQPVTTDDGGLAVTIRHTFATAGEAANLLNSLGSPFSDIVIEHTATEDEVTVTMSGTASLPGGSWDAFGDQPLLQAVGGTPFGAQLAAASATPADSMSIELSVRLPGRIEDTSGNASNGAVRWDVPLDGSTQELTARAVLRPDSGGGWAGPVATIALVLAAAWTAAGAFLAARVVIARSRRPPPRRLY